MSSSSAAFVSTLKKLEYPSRNKLQADGFDWLFDNDEALPFLDWFCSQVSPGNLLTSQELRQYNALRSAEAEILSGSQLEAALEVASLTQEEDLSAEELETEVAVLEEELRAVDKRKSVLIHHRNKLSVKSAALAHKSSKLGGVEFAAKRRTKETKEQLQNTCTLLNSSLDDLSKSTSAFISLYSVPSKIVGSVSFLSQTKLQQYHLAEDKFTQELKVFTKKQFFEGIADLAGYGQGDEYKLLNISDPQILLVKGEKPQVREGECNELDRLKKLYPESQKISIKALVEAKRVETAVRFAEECLKATQDMYPDNTNALSGRLHDTYPKSQKAILETGYLWLKGELNDKIRSGRLHDVHSESQKATQETQYLWQEVFPDLLQANAELQATHVLYGDYNLKIMRQNYFTSKQDTLIRQLVVQRARNYFLGMGYEAESQAHQQVHRELSAMEQMLQEYQREHQTRMGLMSDSCLVVPKSPRNTVNSRDVFITHLSDVMKTSTAVENQQLFLTFADVLESATQLAGRLHRLEGLLRDKTHTQQKTIEALEQHMKSCEGAVYDKTALPELQVLLTPPQIQNGINQLDKMIQNMEQIIQEIMGDYSNKIKILKGDPLEARQRQLFIHFFTQPPQLRRELKAITDRLPALSVT